MKIQLLFLFLIFSLALQAQSLSPQVVSTTGGYFQGGTISLSYTAGEIAVQTLSSGNLILTQGFQQPFDLGTFNPENPYPDWQVKAWPNPVVEDLYLQVSSDIRKDLILETNDLTGKICLIRKFETPLKLDPFKINMSDLAEGIYFVKIRSSDYSLQRIVKIRKQ